MSLLNLNSLPAIATYGRRCTSSPCGSWEVNATADGLDVWTHPIEPLTGPEARALAHTLTEASWYRGEDQT